MTVRFVSCRYCSSATEYKHRHCPSFKDECTRCQYRKDHAVYLQNARKYAKGEVIATLDELMEQTLVIWRERTVHIESIKCMQYRGIIQELKGGRFYKAVSKESMVMK